MTLLSSRRLSDSALSESPGGKDRYNTNKQVYDKICSFSMWFQPHLLSLQADDLTAAKLTAAFFKMASPYPFVSPITDTTDIHLYPLL
jgi:hypothetical protein